MVEKAPATKRRGRGLTAAFFVLAILLAALGAAGFVLAHSQDQHNQQTFAAAYRALRNRDAGDAAAVLDRRNATLAAAFGEYAQAQRAVKRTHEAVTAASNDMVTHMNSGQPAAAAQARTTLRAANAAYRVAVQRERGVQQAFLGRLDAYRRGAVR